MSRDTHWTDDIRDPIGLRDPRAPGRRAASEDVVEDVRGVGGHHQTLLVLPRDGSQPPADGAVWRTTIDRYRSLLAARNQSVEPDADVQWQGTLFRASQFLSEELPIRLAHRVQELDHLPDGLNEMPSIQRVKNWYAQSFEVSPPRACVELPKQALKLGISSAT